MRQSIGASYDLKWVIMGALLALVLQMGLLGALWSVWGKKILVGEKGRSLLEVNLDGVRPQWGPNTGGTRVLLNIKPDNDKVNTAQTITAILFGGVKASPFNIQNLESFRRGCAQKCSHQVMADRLFRECNKGCDTATLAAEKAATESCWKPCEEVEGDTTLADDKKAKKWKSLNCDACKKRQGDFAILNTRCTVDCVANKKTADTERSRCLTCKKDLHIYQARAKQCESSVTDCWAFKDDRGRRPPPKVPDLSGLTDPKKRAEKLGEYEKLKKSIEEDNVHRAKQERKQLRTVANVITPPVPSKVGPVAIQILFKSGEKLVSRDAFWFVSPKDKDTRPKIVKQKRRLHDPVRTAGFWILLLLSCLFYFGGGFVVGRFSPGIGMKEAVSTGLFGWLIFEVVLFALGSAGTAQMFTVFIGSPAFIGAAILGALVGQKVSGVHF